MTVRTRRLPTSRMSVRLRATLAATAIVAVALGAASAVLVGVLRGSLHDSAELEAARRAAVTADLLVAGTPTLMLTRGPAAGPALAGAPGQVRAVEPDVVIVDGPSVTQRLALAQAKAAAAKKEARYAVAVRPVTTAGGEVLVEARASLEPAAAALATLQSLLLPGVPALLLLVAGLTWLAVGRALAPVSAIPSSWP